MNSSPLDRFFVISSFSNGGSNNETTSLLAHPSCIPHHASILCDQFSAFLNNSCSNLVSSDVITVYDSLSLLELEGRALVRTDVSHSLVQGGEKTAVDLSAIEGLLFCIANGEDGDEWQYVAVCESRQSNIGKSKVVGGTNTITLLINHPTDFLSLSLSFKVKIIRLQNMKTAEEELCHVEVSIPNCDTIVDLAFQGEVVLIAVACKDEFRVYSTEFKNMDSNEIVEGLTLVSGLDGSGGGGCACLTVSCL